jgi:hypothetical protein
MCALCFEPIRITALPNLKLAAGIVQSIKILLNFKRMLRRNTKRYFCKGSLPILMEFRGI